ncbi:MAG: extracellular solute-binding protein [Proteobacteria bacterium]|nr:extracellular solute-binding protein [Pseudomonadota bacterium]
MTKVYLTRRHAMIGGLALAGAGALGRAAAAEDKRIVLGTWGGDYSQLITKNIDTPFLTSRGWEVVHAEANDTDRAPKLLLEKRLPRGTSDVQAFSSAFVAKMVGAEVVEKIDYAKLPLAKDLLPALRSDYSLPHIYSGKVILYNPKLISEAPTSFADLWNPKYKGKVGIIDIQYQYTMMAAALASGGSMTNFEPGKAGLLEAKKLGVKIYPTNEAMAQALKTEEVGMCIMWKARAVQWQNSGVSVLVVTPKEGVIAFVSEFLIPKNAPNKDGAYAFLNATLEAKAQEGFAADMGYNPTVTSAKVPPELNKRIGFSEEEAKRLVNPDYGFIAKNEADLKEWWDKSFKG